MPNDGHPAEDFLAPRLATLLDQAKSAGIGREVATAILIDLLQNDAGTEVGAPQ